MMGGKVRKLGSVMRTELSGGKCIGTPAVAEGGDEPL